MSLSRRRENSSVAIEDNTEEEVEEEDLVYKHLTVIAVIDLFGN